MTIKLIAFDCDGTLLNDDGKIMPSSVGAIKAARAKGCRIILITGRPYISVKPILKALSLNDNREEYVALFHGALIQNTKGNTLSKTPLNFKDFVDLDLFAVNRQISMVAETQKYIFTTMGNIDLRTSFESYKNRLPIHVKTLHQFINIQHSMEILKILLIGDFRRLNEVERNIPKWIKERFTIARSEDYCIDVSSKIINKGCALKQLANKLNIKPTEIMAFGNADNDIPMIKYAKYGVAMKNSSSQLLKEANIITTTNNEDGISQVITTKVLN